MSGLPVRNERLNRRRLLTSLGTVGTIAVAGCLDDDDDTGDEPDRDDPDTDATDAESAEDEEGDDDDDKEQENDEETATPDPSDLETRAEEFAELLDAGEIEEAYEGVTDFFASQIPPTEMAAFWNQQIATGGDFEGFRSIEYRGETDQGPLSVVGHATFTEGEFEFQYGFSEAGEIASFHAIPVGDWVQPTYVDPDAFTESEHTLKGPGDCEIGATLTVPDTTEDEKVPGVVLVHGSGDQDRDQTAGPNKTFKELAQGLATQGIATLRYDKRTVACSVDLPAATIDDIITDDAVTAVEFLGEQPGVSAVYVAGHSLGGRLAPRIVDRSEAAGMIMLAPLGEPVHEAIVRQQKHVLTLDGELSDQDEQALEAVEDMAARIETLDIDDDETIQIGGGSRGRAFWETLQEYDHAGLAGELDVPTLLVQGGRDYLVTVEDDLPIWEAAFGDDPASEIEVFDDLNHRFQPGEEPATPDEWLEPEHPVDERVIDRIAEFLMDDIAEVSFATTPAVTIVGLV